MNHIDTKYTGGREMSVNDWYELSDMERAQIRLRELREEKFLRECSDLNRENAKIAIYDMLKGILLLAVTGLFILIAIYWQDDIINFLR